MQDKLIYIADDEVKIQDLIKMFLKKEGYEVETFSDGKLLLEAFRRKSPDMILLDIMMPKLDGLEVCTEIRKDSEVPIIIISAKDTEGDKIAGLMLGSDDYMTKPFSPVELVLRVKSIFKRIEFQKNYNEKQDVIYILDLIFYPD